MPWLAVWVNMFIGWLGAHWPRGLPLNPYLEAAAVVLAGLLLLKIARKLAGWVLSAAVVAAMVIVAGRLLGVTM